MFWETQVVFQGFECNVRANLGSEFEAVRDGLLTIVERDRDPIEQVFFYACGIWSWGEPENLERGMDDARFPRVAGQGYIDLVRYLRRQVVDRQCREQADHRRGNTQCNLDEIGIREGRETS